MTNRSILVYHYGALGDFISILPLLRILKKNKLTITLLGKPRYGQIAYINNDIDTILDAESSETAFLFSQKHDYTRFASFFETFDSALLFSEIGSPLAVNVTTHSNGNVICQPPFPADTRHIIDYHLSLAKNAIISLEDRIPSLAVAIKKHFSLFELPGGKPTAALHPGSGSPLKNWPFKRFLEVAALLRDHGYIVAWFSGEAEDSLTYPRGDIHFRNIPLVDCAKIVSECAIYCGNDSGMTHLAAAAGCPTVAIFGPSDPVVWAPRGRNKVTIVHPSRCPPCHLKPSKIECTRQCLLTITADEVFRKMISISRAT